MTTPDTLEKAARELCRIDGVNPDGGQWWEDECFGPFGEKNWEKAAKEIKRHLQIQQALTLAAEAGYAEVEDARD